MYVNNGKRLVLSRSSLESGYEVRLHRMIERSGCQRPEGFYVYNRVLVRKRVSCIAEAV